MCKGKIDGGVGYGVWYHDCMRVTKEVILMRMIYSLHMHGSICSIILLVMNAARKVLFDLNSVSC